MLTKEGWDTLPDSAKDPTTWSGDEAGKNKETQEKIKINQRRFLLIK